MCRVWLGEVGAFDFGIDLHGKGIEGALTAMKTTDPAAAHFDRGNALLQSRRLEEALASYDQALAIAPDHAAAHAQRGGVLKLMKRPAEAEDDLRRALALDSDLFDAHYNLGNLLRETRRFSEAEACFRHVLELQPRLHQAHNNLGLVVGELGRVEEAVMHFSRAIELKPDYVDSFVNLGHALRMTGDAAKAEAACRRALSLAPGNATVFLNLGLALQDLGRHDEALACFRRSGACNPNYAKAILCEALALLQAGNLADGFEKYEARWRTGELRPRHPPALQWHNGSLAGQRILLHAEQGLGDTIQFLRYVPLVANAGGALILEVQKALLPLAARLPCRTTLIAQGEPLPGFDLHCPLMSLARAFGATLGNIPSNQNPYLSAAPTRVADWHRRLPATAALKIGIAWVGNPVHPTDRFRSIRLSALAPLFDIPGIHWYSLQVGRRSADLGAGRYRAITDLSNALTDFGETAAAITNLDLVVSVDTAVAHLAGALGKPVWVMLPFAADWRWLLDRSDSPWYPTMRLFRQRAPGDWDDVVAKVATALGQKSLAGKSFQQPG